MSDHAALVYHGARWLRHYGCRLVIPEARARENAAHPDVIGWLPNSESIVIEAKSNRVDFRDDWRPDRKHFRRDGTGMGVRRYYICRPGVISDADARRRSWGLIHVYPSESRNVVPSPEHERNATAELRLLARLATNSEVYPNQLSLEFS